MQRKNSLLKSSSKRNGMAMIMAIAVIVVISTIMALSLSLTNTTSKKTSDLYLYEQAVILSHSAAEYAVLRMSQVAPCSLPNIDFPYNNTYDINITMRYISFAGSACETNALADTTNIGTTTTLESDGTVIMDITVSIPDNINVSTEPIRYFRRTIQKL